MIGVSTVGPFDETPLFSTALLMQPLRKEGWLGIQYKEKELVQMLDLGLYLCLHIVVSTRGCAGTCRSHQSMRATLELHSHICAGPGRERKRYRDQKIMVILRRKWHMVFEQQSFLWSYNALTCCGQCR